MQAVSAILNFNVTEMCRSDMESPLIVLLWPDKADLPVFYRGNPFGYLIFINIFKHAVFYEMQAFFYISLLYKAYDIFQSF
jgi:hypothetical protein